MKFGVLRFNQSSPPPITHPKGRGGRAVIQAVIKIQRFNRPTGVLGCLISSLKIMVGLLFVQFSQGYLHAFLTTIRMVWRGEGGGGLFSPVGDVLIDNILCRILFEYKITKKLRYLAEKNEKKALLNSLPSQSKLLYYINYKFFQFFFKFPYMLIIDKDKQRQSKRHEAQDNIQG